MKTKVALAAVATFGLAGTAMADIDLNLPDFSLTSDSNGPLDDFTVSWSGYLEGFAFAGNFDDPDGGMWASDTRLQVYLDGSEVYNIGGFSGVQNPWDFQGSGSSNPGFYSHGPDGAISGSGDWDFVFTNGWFSDSSNPIVWNGAVLTLINAVPAPGALALLGLAGLAGASRRRR